MDIQKEVIDIVAKQLDLKTEDIKPENEFIEDLKADSLDLVELIMLFEEKFDIQIPDEDAENIQTVKKAIDYIKKKKS